MLNVGNCNATTNDNMMEKWNLKWVNIVFLVFAVVIDL